MHDFSALFTAPTFLFLVNKSVMNFYTQAENTIALSRKIFHQNTVCRFLFQLLRVKVFISELVNVKLSTFYNFSAPAIRERAKKGNALCDSFLWRKTREKTQFQEFLNCFAFFLCFHNYTLKGQVSTIFQNGCDIVDFYTNSRVVGFQE